MKIVYIESGADFKINGRLSVIQTSVIRSENSVPVFWLDEFLNMSIKVNENDKE